jgi:hypothetical protein
MGGRPRHRGQANGEPNAKPVDDLLNRRDEPLPLVVRLRADEQKERNTAGVGHLVQGDLRDLDGREVIDDIRHSRPPRAIVEDLVNIEGGDQPVFARGQQVIRSQTHARPSIDEAGERVDKHGAINRRRLAVDGVQLLWWSHDEALLWSTYLLSLCQRSPAARPSVRSLRAKNEPASPRVLRTLAQTDVTA